MSNLKTLKSILMTLAIALTFSACNNSDNNSDDPKPTPPAKDGTYTFLCYVCADMLEFENVIFCASDTETDTQREIKITKASDIKKETIAEVEYYLYTTTFNYNTLPYTFSYSISYEPIADAEVDPDKRYAMGASVMMSSYAPNGATQSTGSLKVITIHGEDKINLYKSKLADASYQITVDKEGIISSLKK